MYREIFDVFGISIDNVSLISLALTHPSYAKFKNLPHNQSYERLEFLGDAVLKLFASEILYNMYPDFTEGELSKIRSYLVSDNSLSEIAIKLGLDRYLILSSGEEKSGGRRLVSINACAFEALLGAFYLGGKEFELKLFLQKVLEPKIVDIETHLVRYNAKEVLQEYTQQTNKNIPKYEVTNISGAAHEPVFEVDVIYENKILAHGVGKTKKEAQQNAAFKACERLGLIK